MNKHPKHISELQQVIHHLHGADAFYQSSVPVKEVFQGQIVWDGIVEVFDLKGHPQASRVYAWSHDTDDPKHPKRHVTVLHIPPVVSPETAVRASIVNDSRKHAKKHQN